MHWCVALTLALWLSPASVAALRQLELTLDEEFDDFNLTLWRHDLTLGGGGNWEFEYYTNNRTSSYVKDGVLYIQPVLLADEIGDDNVRGQGAGAGYNMDIWGMSPADSCTGPQFYGCFRTAGQPNYINPVKSARISTVRGFTFTYGRVEIKAQMPRGDWLWPAIWMVGADEQYGKWPASGEIDIMETRGNAPSYPPGGCDTFSSTLHWGPSWNADKWSLTHKARSGTDLTKDFHIYGLIWNETYIGTYFDTENNIVLSHMINESFWELGGWPSPPWQSPWVGRGKNAPFDRPFYLIINLAVGGTNGYFPDGQGNKPWSDTDQQAIDQFYNAKDQWFPTWSQPMAIDSVKVWTYTDSDIAKPPIPKYRDAQSNNQL